MTSERSGVEDKLTAVNLFGVRQVEEDVATFQQEVSDFANSRADATRIRGEERKLVSIRS